MKMSYKGLECQLKARSGLEAAIGDLCSEAVIYAACRLFSRSESLCREYVTASYRMRLASGKGRKSRNCRCVIPGFLAEIDSDFLQISFTVDSTGVTIQSIKPLGYINAE